MSIIHFGTLSAAGGASGPEVDFQRDFTSITAIPNPTTSSAVLVVYGDNYPSLEGEWRATRNGAIIYQLDWVTANSLATSEYYTRIIDASNNNPVSTPEPRYTHSFGDWSQQRTAWRSLRESVSPPGANMNSSFAHTYAAYSNYFSADRELLGNLQIGRLDSNEDVTFEFSQVSIGTDSINVTAHGLEAGDWVQYIQGGGAAPTPLTNGSFYAIIDNGVNSFKLATTMADASTNTAVNLTFTGTGTGHIMRPIKAKDTMNINLVADGFA